MEGFSHYGKKHASAPSEPLRRLIPDLVALVIEDVDQPRRRLHLVADPLAGVVVHAVVRARVVAAVVVVERAVSVVERSVVVVELADLVLQRAGVVVQSAVGQRR